MNNQTKRHSVLLDIDLFSVEPNLKVSKLIPKLKEINNEIFNIFNWALSDQAKSFLSDSRNE